MMSRALSLSMLMLLAGAVSVKAATPGASGFVVPDGGFVFDGGDAEVARGDSQVSALDTGSLLAAPPGLQRAEALPLEPSSTPSATVSPAVAAQGPPAPRARAFEYSDGYRTRLKIHKYASYATLPLFIAEYAVGKKLYDGNYSDSTRSLHRGLAATMGGLFAVNTVTGVWNLSEGRKDPNHRTKRMVHGILMLVSDAGFVATGLTAPNHEGEGGGSRSTHRTVALSSMGVATVAYLMMLIH